MTSLKALLSTIQGGELLWSRPLSPRGDSREALVTLPDGSILVGGSFTNVGDIQRKYIALLSECGVIQTQFAPEPNGIVLTMSRQYDGKILIGGNFTSINGIARARMARLMPDGRLDELFDPGALMTAERTAFASLPDGKILVSGNFNRRNVSALAIDSNGNYVIGGDFEKIGRRAVHGIARILPSSSAVVVDFVDEIFSAGEQYRQAVVELMRYGPTGGELIVDVWTEPGADRELAEFKPFSTEVRFGPSDLDKTVIVPFPDDGEVEFTEYIPVHCRIRGEDHVNTSQISVIDDEKPVVSIGSVPLPPGYGISVSASTRRAVGNGRLAFSGYIYTEAAEYGPHFYGIGVVNLDGSPSGFTPARIDGGTLRTRRPFSGRRTIN